MVFLLITFYSLISRWYSDNVWHGQSSTELSFGTKDFRVFGLQHSYTFFIHDSWILDFYIGVPSVLLNCRSLSSDWCRWCEVQDQGGHGCGLHFLQLWSVRSCCHPRCWGRLRLFWGVVHFWWDEPLWTCIVLAADFVKHVRLVLILSRVTCYHVRLYSFTSTNLFCIIY